jgi:hypothetical protein
MSLFRLVLAAGILGNLRGCLGVWACVVVVDGDRMKHSNMLQALESRATTPADIGAPWQKSHITNAMVDIGGRLQHHNVIPLSWVGGPISAS